MRYTIIIFIIALIAISCSKKENFSFSNKNWKVDTIEVNGLKVIRGKSNLETKALMFKDGNILFSGENYVACQYLDINNDGFEDIRVYNTKKNIGPCITYLFDVENQSFEEIENINVEFEKLQDNFYYSNDKLGCEGWIWQSLFFQIDNFKAEKIARLFVDTCDKKEDGVYVYKYEQSKEVLDTVIPFSSKLVQESGLRSDFIRQYWNIKLSEK